MSFRYTTWWFDFILALRWRVWMCGFFSFCFAFRFPCVIYLVIVGESFFRFCCCRWAFWSYAWHTAHGMTLHTMSANACVQVNFIWNFIAIVLYESSTRSVCSFTWPIVWRFGRLLVSPSTLREPESKWIIFGRLFRSPCCCVCVSGNDRIMKYIIIVQGSVFTVHVFTHEKTRFPSFRPLVTFIYYFLLFIHFDYVSLFSNRNQKMTTETMRDYGLSGASGFPLQFMWWSIGFDGRYRFIVICVITYANSFPHKTYSLSI